MGFDERITPPEWLREFVKLCRERRTVHYQLALLLRLRDEILLSMDLGIDPTERQKSIEITQFCKGISQKLLNDLNLFWRERIS